MPAQVNTAHPFTWYHFPSGKEGSSLTAHRRCMCVTTSCHLRLLKGEAVTVPGQEGLHHRPLLNRLVQDHILQYQGCIPGCVAFYWEADVDVVVLPLMQLQAHFTTASRMPEVVLLVTYLSKDDDLKLIVGTQPF